MMIVASVFISADWYLGGVRKEGGGAKDLNVLVEHIGC